MYRRYVKGDHNKGQVVSRAEAMQELEADKYNHRFKIFEYNKKSNYYQYETIPCRHCWACQLNYSAEWATRITKETEKSEHNWYITLTYDDEHLPKAEDIVDSDGVKYDYNPQWEEGTLYEEDMKRFIKTLRKHFERKNHTAIKYFYCGEYGSETHRPHYHIILLNCPLDIDKLYDCHVDGKFFKAHWKHTDIEKWWGQGIVDVAEVEWSCAAYVARYCSKKLSYQRKEDYYEQGKIPEFIRMSNGIGMDWYEEHKDEIYKNDEMIMKTVKGNIGRVKPPKAYDKKYQEENPELFKKIQKGRKLAADRAEKMLEILTDRSDYENLILKAQKVEQKMKLLPRMGEW